jgi:hypothetical protein
MRLLLLLATLTLSGCALTPEEMRSASVQRLCDAYAAPLSPQLMDPGIKSELISRGAVHCTTVEYLQARASALQGMGTSMQLLQQGQRRSYAPAAPLQTFPQPVRCTTQYNALSNTYQSICN